MYLGRITCFSSLVEVNTGPVALAGFVDRVGHLGGVARRTGQEDTATNS